MDPGLVIGIVGLVMTTVSFLNDVVPPLLALSPNQMPPELKTQIEEMNSYFSSEIQKLGKDLLPLAEQTRGNSRAIKRRIQRMGRKLKRMVDEQNQTFAQIHSLDEEINHQLSVWQSEISSWSTTTTPSLLTNLTLTP